MDKFEIQVELDEFLKATRLDMSQVAVGYGAAMVLMGLRAETSDVDLDIPVAAYEAMKATGNFKVTDAICGECMDWSEKLSVHPPKEEYGTVMVRGIRCYDEKKMLQTKVASYLHPERRKDKLRQDLIDIRNLADRMIGPTL